MISPSVCSLLLEWILLCKGPLEARPNCLKHCPTPLSGCLYLLWALRCFLVLGVTRLPKILRGNPFSHYNVSHNSCSRTEAETTAGQLLPSEGLSPPRGGETTSSEGPSGVEEITGSVGEVLGGLSLGLCLGNAKTQEEETRDHQKGLAGGWLYLVTTFEVWGCMCVGFGRTA